MSKNLKLALLTVFVLLVGTVATVEAVRADGGPNPPCFPGCGPSGN